MDIIYIGNELTAFAFKDYAEKNNMTIKVIGGIQNDFSKLKDEIIENAPKYVILNIEQTINTDNEIVSAIEKLKIAVNSKIIIFAKGYSRETAVINTLISKDINNFVFGNDLGTQEVEVKRCIEDYATEAKEEEKEKIIENRIALQEQKEDILPYKVITPDIQNDIPKTHENILHKKSIAVLGAMSRIGTTTIALQLTKWLKTEGKTACFVERSTTEYIRPLLDTIEVESHSINKKMVSHKSIEMFYDPKKVFRDMEYEYIVYDFGALTNENDIKWASIFEKDIIIAVCGIKAGEIEKTNSLLKILYEYAEPYYIFNFVHENDQEKIKDMMSQRKAKTYFSGYSPDPFILCNNNADTFQDIINRKKEVNTFKKTLFAGGN